MFKIMPKMRVERRKIKLQSFSIKFLLLLTTRNVTVFLYKCSREHCTIVSNHDLTFNLSIEIIMAAANNVRFNTKNGRKATKLQSVEVIDMDNPGEVSQILRT